MVYVLIIPDISGIVKKQSGNYNRNKEGDFYYNLRSVVENNEK